MLPKRSWMVGAANHSLSALWNSGCLDKPQLDTQALIETAQQKAGLNDFGDDWFLQPLTKMISALNTEARLNALGRFVAHGQIVKILRDRLWTQYWAKTQPQLFTPPLRAPIIVVGPMRSGTTRLHRLLSADQRFAHMRFFETISPTPHPEFRHGDKDKRPAFAKRLLAAVHRANPRTATIHPTGPMQPEEELGLLVSSAWGMKHEAQWMVPSYGRWSEAQDATPAYAHMARLLQLVSWARGDHGDNRPWVLKTPQHMLDLPALMQTFPDARLIFIHRDPVRVVGSACSLVWNQMTIHSDHADGHWIGKEWLRKTRLKIDRMRSARANIPHNQMIDVHYSEMDTDWKSVMARVYNFLNMDITPALPTMHNYISSATRQEYARKQHRYTLSAFGLKEQEVRDYFQSYIHDYDLGDALNSGNKKLLAPARLSAEQSPAY